MFRGKQILAAFALCLLLVLAYTPGATAGPQQSSSTNYGVSEVNFGSGGELHACSTTYCAKQSAGELTVGNTASTNYQAQAGFNTNREELLEVNVTTGAINLGTLSTASAKFGSTTFSVRNYLSSGYVVRIDGSSPRDNNNTHSLTALTTPTASTAGQEQFGINLVLNTTPAVGADPLEVPDSTFSFGTAASGYNTANSFKFVTGDTIAQSTKSSGVTTYTMSVIENIATNTPAGQYRTNLNINVIPTF